MSEPYPTIDQVEEADREQIARWYYYLPRSEVASEQKIMERIIDRFMNMGGMTPGLLDHFAAAAWCGVSPNQFTDFVEPVVPPVYIGGKKVWSVKCLQLWVDGRTGIRSNDQYNSVSDDDWLAELHSAGSDYTDSRR